MQHSTIDLVSVIESARQTQNWTVVVCPTQEVVHEARKVLASALTQADRYSGRTAKLYEGGTVSVVHQNDEPFSEQFDIKFMGHWGPKTKKERMGTWRQAAHKVL